MDLHSSPDRRLLEPIPLPPTERELVLCTVPMDVREDTTSVASMVAVAASIPIITALSHVCIPLRINSDCRDQNQLWTVHCACLMMGRHCVDPEHIEVVSALVKQLQDERGTCQPGLKMVLPQLDNLAKRRVKCSPYTIPARMPSMFKNYIGGVVLEPATLAAENPDHLLPPDFPFGIAVLSMLYDTGNSADGSEYELQRVLVLLNNEQVVHSASNIKVMVIFIATRGPEPLGANFLTQTEWGKNMVPLDHPDSVMPSSIHKYYVTTFPPHFKVSAHGVMATDPPVTLIRMRGLLDHVPNAVEMPEPVQESTVPAVKHKWFKRPAKTTPTA